MIHEEPYQALFARFYGAFETANLTQLKDAVTPDWQDIPLNPGQGPGPDGIAPMLSLFSAAFSDLKIVIYDLLRDGDRFAVRAQIQATHTGEFLGAAATGKPVSISLHEFHQVRDGKISHTWHLEDWFGFLNQVGAWPAK